MSARGRGTRPRRAERAPAAALLLLAALAAGGCGKRGAPLPPLRRNPEAVTELAARQRGDTLELSFTAPRLTLDGARLPVLDVEILYGFAHGVPLAEIAETRALKAAPGEALVEVWPLPEPGTPMRFAIRTRADGKASPLSAELAWDVVPPPPPPSDVAASVRAEGIRLLWSECVPTSADPWIRPLVATAELQRALAELAAFTRGEPPPSAAPEAEPGAGAPEPAVPEGVEPPPRSEAEAGRPAWERAPGRAGERPAVPPGAAPAEAAPARAEPAPRPTPPSPGVSLYRRAGTGEYEPLAGTPVAEGTYLDAAVEPGESYCYTARTVLADPAGVEGKDSAEVCLAFRDVGVPEPPFGLTLLRLEDGTVELSWSASPSEDVDRYRIYRRAEEGEAEIVGERPAGERRWVDTAPAAGRQSSYSVTALDPAGNESPATPEARVDLR